ncbi:aminotransferase class I/II-fold pyridoxal phosphate-dependent enzyme [Flavobacterium kingsejongi]|uniref:8-amino-7-oxononanoate synthase n=1 Tax=Flavobacterium kingsejongi TaxID=1678728 RepID=A0A2S1LM53_9FLAO|nr:8-amino-7-oxononanoate synthase [Flavobacterium kingsejongi]AWG24799.1 8-amino-7-oxononanoate synthase [Flavobacterium kingsejongi]
MAVQFPKSLALKLSTREDNASLRQLQPVSNLIDFSSNDYLGFSKSEVIFSAVHSYLIEKGINSNGSTGSRLLSGNHNLYEITEAYIAEFHQAESALIFNSGYDANIGFFSAVPQKNDLVLFDEYCHASIRAGIQLSHSKAYKFRHNDLDQLEQLILRCKASEKGQGEIYIATESVFSMDGDSPDFKRLIEIAAKYNCLLVVDEAHALGVFGTSGEGLLQYLGLQDQVFARIMTFGKGLGCHGAAILGADGLKKYLINFARSFIYTTALPPHALATIFKAYEQLAVCTAEDGFPVNSIRILRENISHFNAKIMELGLTNYFIPSNSAIHCALIGGNANCRAAGQFLKEKGFEVKAILAPTVTEGEERLRFCLHSYTTTTQITEVLEAFAEYRG